MTLYHVTRSFRTRVARSERVLAMAEAFGLGLEEKEFHVFQNRPIGSIADAHVAFAAIAERDSGREPDLRLHQQFLAERERIRHSRDLRE